MRPFSNLPLFVTLMALAAASMFPPAIIAAQVEQLTTARAFFYSGILLIILTVLLALATRGQTDGSIGRSYLISMVGSFFGLPVLFAVPVFQSIPDTTFFNSYFEMVSSFTTTGASTFDAGRINSPLHLWRAEVAWLGGLFVWITAAAVLAPLNLGGYEISAKSEPGSGVGGRRSKLQIAESSNRLGRATAELLPIYAGLTVVLWVSLFIAGTDPLESLVLAMSTMSTSGITLGPPDQVIPGGIAVEFLVLLFLVFAISRRAFSTESALKTTARLVEDPEMRVGVLLILVATGALYLRHFGGAVEVGAKGEAVAALSALWGTFFTVVSFLTSTGFVSSNWVDAQAWSGLTTPGFALLGLAMIGGGVATTAGGVKLLRVYALYIHGKRELRRLIHPSIIQSKGKPGREVPLRGVYVAWLFFMLFALSVAAIWVALAACSVPFDQAMLLTISALSTTGPLAPVVSDGGIVYGDLSAPVKSILMVAMILGRLETLALIALLNPDIWRG